MMLVKANTYEPAPNANNVINCCAGKLCRWQLKSLEGPKTLNMKNCQINFSDINRDDKLFGYLI